MPQCNKRLISPTQGWIGTVSHIVAAEDDGPRADPTMPVEERRHYNNLLLLCADHGRDVDDRQTGAAAFPVEALQRIKREHSQRIAELVDQVVRSTTIHPRTVADVLDTSRRLPIASQTAAALIDYLNGGEEEVDADFADQVRRELESCRALLTDLSKVGRTSLAALIELWDSTRDVLPDGTKLVGEDPYRRHPMLQVHQSRVWNRALSQSGLSDALAELEDRGLLESPDPEEEHPAERFYMILSPWSTEWTTWRRLCGYLEGAHGLNLASWVKDPDFSLFDAPSPGRTVPRW